jgi:hypothetical protein
MGRRLVLGVGAAALIALAAAGAAVSSAAGPRGHAQARIEGTVTCAAQAGALQIIAFARNPAAGGASASVFTGNPSTPTLLAGVDTRHTHYVLDGSCDRVRAKVPLTHRGLTSAGVVHAGDYTSPAVYCAAPRRVLVHFQFGFDAGGKPVSATIAVRTKPRAHKKSKAIGYVQWSPKRSVTYYSHACTAQ